MNGQPPNLGDRPPKNETTSIPNRRPEDIGNIDTSSSDFMISGTYNKTKGGPLVFGDVD
jgi:hypothetical protein